MKLVEIKECLRNQVWKNKDDNSLYEIDFVDNGDVVATNDFEENFRIELAEEIFIRKFELIGFLNITHKLENNKLAEIPRKEFEVDDVFVYTEYDGSPSYYSLHEITKDGEFLLISDNDDKVLSGVYADTLLEEGLLKCGILGVEFEWKNDKLINER